MKNSYIYFLFALVLGASACNPMKDIHDELDQKLTQNDDWYRFISGKTLVADAEYTKDAPYTLADADYALSSKESIKKNKNFGKDSLSFEDNVTEVLGNKYMAKAGETMFVTYNTYIDHHKSADTTMVTFDVTNTKWLAVPSFNFAPTAKVDKATAYTLTADDYAMVGENPKYGSFTLSHYKTAEEVYAKLYVVLKAHFMVNMKEGQVFEVTYKTYNKHSDIKVETPLYVKVTL